MGITFRHGATPLNLLVILALLSSFHVNAAEFDQSSMELDQDLEILETKSRPRRQREVVQREEVELPAPTARPRKERIKPNLDLLKQRPRVQIRPKTDEVSEMDTGTGEVPQGNASDTDTTLNKPTANESAEEDLLLLLDEDLSDILNAIGVDPDEKYQEPKILLQTSTSKKLNAFWTLPRREKTRLLKKHIADHKLMYLFGTGSGIAAGVTLYLYFFNQNY